jgi:LPXTG-motif cell wall-anchored protein
MEFFKKSCCLGLILVILFVMVSMVTAETKKNYEIEYKSAQLFAKKIFYKKNGEIALKKTKSSKFFEVKNPNMKRWSIYVSYGEKGKATIPILLGEKKEYETNQDIYSRYKSECKIMSKIILRGEKYGVKLTPGVNEIILPIELKKYKLLEKELKCKIPYSKKFKFYCKFIIDIREVVTPEPTSEPTPELTPEPTIEPTIETTPEPEQDEKLNTKELPETGERNPLLYFLIGGYIIMVGILCGYFIVKKVKEEVSPNKR